MVEKEDEEGEVQCIPAQMCEKTLGATWRSGTIGDIVEREDWPLTRSVLGDLGSPALTGGSAVQVFG